MKIKAEELKYVAGLARIKLSKKETGLLSKQLNSIFEYMDKLNQLDTKDVEPMSHVLDLSNVFREDRIKKSLNRKDALKNTPSADNEFFKVPRVL